MFCRQCGTQNDSSSLFCSKCGAAMSASAAQFASSPLVPAAAAPVSAPIPPAASLFSRNDAKPEAQPFAIGASFAGMGDRAIAAVLDTIVVAIVFVPVGMWAAARWGGNYSQWFRASRHSGILYFLDGRHSLVSLLLVVGRSVRHNVGQAGHESTRCPRGRKQDRPSKVCDS